MCTSDGLTCVPRIPVSPSLELGKGLSKTNANGLDFPPKMEIRDSSPDVVTIGSVLQRKRKYKLKEQI